MLVLPAHAIWGLNWHRGFHDQASKKSTSEKPNTQRVFSFLPPTAKPDNKVTVTSNNGLPGSAALQSATGDGNKAQLSEDPLAPVSLASMSQQPSLSQLVQQKPPADAQLNAPLSVVSDQQKNQSDDRLIAKAEALDKENLAMLWDATVEQNPMIRFSLEKLALPVDLHAKHSSQFATRTLSALITGATLGASMFSGINVSPYQNMGIYTAGDIARNLVTGQNKVVEATLTPSELVQLAGLVDELKVSLINAYYDYKNNLSTLAAVTLDTQKHRAVFEYTTFKSSNPSAALASSAAYYQALQQETRLRQSAQQNRMRIERLAGIQAADKLQWRVDAKHAVVQAPAS
ncbi:MAG: hypothetical protein VKK59_06115 [Vampirovibrionales bacterium]|nr:hypothetical protein [Vampirovibrionales bacterium]